MTMTRIDIKILSSKELRELRVMIREELDFRAEIGKEIEIARRQGDVSSEWGSSAVERYVDQSWRI